MASTFLPPFHREDSSIHASSNFVPNAASDENRSERGLVMLLWKKGARTVEKAQETSRSNELVC
jgi:hypothetical protein